MDKYGYTVDISMDISMIMLKNHIWINMDN